jgi:hypothetical protein
MRARFFARAELLARLAESGARFEDVAVSATAAA